MKRLEENFVGVPPASGEHKNRKHAYLRRTSAHCLLLMAAACSLPMYASQLYTLTFTTTIGAPAPVSGSFTYDPVAGFSNFLVVWDGITFNETAGANSPILYAPTGCTGEASTATFGLAIMAMTAANCPTPSYSWSGEQDEPSLPTAEFTFNLYTQVPTGGGGSQVGRATVYDQVSKPPGNGAGAQGTWTITPPVASVPEPGSFWLLGIPLLGFIRRRASVVRRKYCWVSARTAKRGQVSNFAVFLRNSLPVPGLPLADHTPYNLRRTTLVLLCYKLRADCPSGLAIGPPVVCALVAASRHAGFMFRNVPERRHECRRGTHECVRHNRFSLPRIGA
jgi:hypothetical protein